MLRSRRDAKAIALDTETERNLVMRVLLHSPKDTVAGFLAMAAVVAIVVNALFLQAGRHPAPMFGAAVALPAVPALASGNPLPRPRPTEADALATDTRLIEPRTVGPRATESRSADPLTNLVKATTGTTQAPGVVRPPAPIPVTRNELSGARRVAAVQRALTEYGYGQLKPSGIAGADTQAAIQKFEREHKMPVTGQVSDRLLRELSVAIGRAIE